MSKKWSAQIFGSIALLVPQLNMWGLVGYHGAMEVVGVKLSIEVQIRENFPLVFVGLISCILGDSEYTHIYVYMYEYVCISSKASDMIYKSGSHRTTRDSQIPLQGREAPTSVRYEI